MRPCQFQSRAPTTFADAFVYVDDLTNHRVFTVQYGEMRLEVEGSSLATSVVDIFRQYPRPPPFEVL
mgnify:CR=1 FL=1